MIRKTAFAPFFFVADFPGLLRASLDAARDAAFEPRWRGQLFSASTIG